MEGWRVAKRNGGEVVRRGGEGGRGGGGLLRGIE